MQKSKKREINGNLKTILELDKKLTSQFVKWSQKCFQLKSLNTYCKGLEISCNGILWIFCLLAFMWLFNTENFLILQINLMLGLILDIIYIAVIKAITRRRRPTPDYSFTTFGPDKFSFPSGHASRAFFVTYFFNYLYPLNTLLVVPILVWAICVSFSRVMLYRHHLLDVICGIGLGIIEGFVLGWFWLGADACKYIYSWLSDETWEGAEGAV